MEYHLKKDHKEQLLHHWDFSMDKLMRLWKEIGIVDDKCKVRVDTVLLHLKNLLDQMVAEESDLRERLVANIDTEGDKVFKLCDELGLPPHEPPENLGLLSLDKHLKSTARKLEDERNHRLQILREFQCEEQKYCDLFSVTPNYIPSGCVPTQEQLDELKQHVHKLTQEKEHRMKVFKSTKQSLEKLYKELEQDPNSSLEKEIMGSEEDSFLLSNDNMHSIKSIHDKLEQQQQENFSLASELRNKLESLWERLQTPAADRETFNTKNTGFKPSVIESLKQEISIYELLKQDNMQKVITAARKELVEWWDKCYYSMDQRKAFTGFRSQNFTEDLLDAHDQELQKVKAYYQDNTEMLCKVARRQELFEQFLEHERKAKDPNRFHNRGCNLLKEQNARRRVEKELPKVEQEVKEQIEEWEKRNNKVFVVGGVRFVDFIAKQWDDFRNAKEMEKQQRHQDKIKTMEEELLYGSRPVTPAKRYNGAPLTPGSSKRRRPDENTVADSVMSECKDSMVSKRRRPVAGRREGLPPIPTQRNRQLSPTKGCSNSGQPNTMMFDDTAKTPNSTRIRSNHTTMSSPMYAARSAAKTPNRPGVSGRPTVLNSVKTPSRTTTARTPGRPGDNVRKALHDNTNVSTMFSHTTVAGAGVKLTSTPGSDMESIASIDNYNEFTHGLTHTARPNCRSSVLPKPAFF